jgi:hypothetical protein
MVVRLLNAFLVLIGVTVHYFLTTTFLLLDNEFYCSK